MPVSREKNAFRGLRAIATDSLSEASVDTRVIYNYHARSRQGGRGDLPPFPGQLEIWNSSRQLCPSTRNRSSPVSLRNSPIRSCPKAYLPLISEARQNMEAKLLSAVRKDWEGIAIPVVLMLTGLILLGGDYFGAWSLDRIVNYWPVAIIAVGLTELLPVSTETER